MGALKGAKTAAQEWLKKTVFCFAKGTLIFTTVGLVAIENIQPGDVVYAKEARCKTIVSVFIQWKVSIKWGAYG